MLATENNLENKIFNRDYDAESERRKNVEEFYRNNHINQSFEFVRPI